MTDMLELTRKAFSRFDSHLRLFAHQNSLRIREFERGSPDWLFIAKHPNDGIFQIYVLCLDPVAEQFRLGVIWTSNDYISMKNKTSHKAIREGSIVPATVVTELNECLKVAISERPAQWETIQDFSESWSKVPLEERAKMFGLDRYPFPSSPNGD